jgi:ABC-type multidrug transport system fused ATPase/permease subunit
MSEGRDEAGAEPEVVIESVTSELTRDEIRAATTKYGLDRLALPLVITGVLSLISSVTESLGLAGLAALLTRGLGAGSVVFGNKLLTNAWVILGLALITLVVSGVNALYQTVITSDWEARRRKEMIEAYREASFAAQREHSGAALAMESEQIAQASSVIGYLAGLINSLIRLSIYLAVALLSSWQVTLIAVVSGGTLMASLRVLSKRTRAMHRHVAAKRVIVADDIGHLAASARELTLLSRWDDSVSTISGSIVDIRNLKVRAVGLANLVGPIFATGASTVGLAIGVWSQHGDSASTTRLATSGLLLIRALSGAQSTQTSYQSLHDNLPYFERARAALARLRIDRRPDATPLGETARHIEVRDATFSHVGEPVLEHFSLDLDGPGGVAIVGPSGCGKSTLMSGLAGFLTPDSGSVEIQGRSLEEVSTGDLGRHVGLLPQDPGLLRASMRANLLRPESTADDDTVRQALARMALDGVVDDLEEGLDTLMGAAREGLSGGEMQRVGLVRLLLNDPDIWLLDEPTSALDLANINRVGAVITEAMEHHLVVVITHRSELLAHCKRLVMMEAGGIVDAGPPAEVARRQPFVAAMLAGHHQNADGEPDPGPGDGVEADVDTSVR